MKVESTFNVVPCQAYDQFVIEMTGDGAESKARDYEYRFYLWHPVKTNRYGN